MSRFEQFSTTEYLMRFDVYRVAMRAVAATYRLCESLPRGHGDLASQLRRSSKSVQLNIAEGLGRNAAGDKRRAFSIARGECLESCAALHLAREIGQMSDDVSSVMRDFDRVSAMLTGLVRRWEGTPQGDS